MWRTIAILSFSLALAGVHATDRNGDAIQKAVTYLSAEVRDWSRENKCFSCHNNGDGARALIAASRQGFDVPEEALRETREWLLKPHAWDSNKGDPGFSDKALADLQFATTLSILVRHRISGKIDPTSSNVLHDAIARVAQRQSSEGTWEIDPHNTSGSPATYGTALATYFGWRLLRSSSAHAEKAQASAAALKRIQLSNVPASAALLLFAETQKDAELAESAKRFLIETQNRDGGWGPYKHSPSDVFDTALAIIALSSKGQKYPAIIRGRSFLIQQQREDGSWPETTRPSGSESYAQRISTTAWALQALIAIRKN